jgi:Outer membrane protein beta-barrel domain
MKTLQFNLRYKIAVLLLMLVFISKIALSQTDTTITKQGAEKNEKSGDKKKKKSNGFIIYGAATFNQMSMSANSYESIMVPGWGLGAAYKHGRFFYWQAGARYNNAVYEVHLTGATPDSVLDNLISVQDIDVPVTAGINLLSVTQKVLGLRLFLSAVPSFVLGVSNNGYANFTKDKVNDFNFYGQGGVGVDILFLTIEAGYNYGFTDVFKNTQSNPQQVFLNIGFRF